MKKALLIFVIIVVFYILLIGSLRLYIRSPNSSDSVTELYINVYIIPFSKVFSFSPNALDFLGINSSDSPSVFIEDKSLITENSLELYKDLRFSFENTDALYTTYRDFIYEAQNSLEVPISSKRWSWELDPLQGAIISIGKIKKIVGIEVSSPKHIVSKGNPHIFKLLCNTDNSILVSARDIELQESHIDPFSKLEIGDGIFSYCTDSSCSSLGRGCVVVKK